MIMDRIAIAEEQLNIVRDLYKRIIQQKDEEIKKKDELIKELQQQIEEAKRFLKALDEDYLG